MRTKQSEKKKKNIRLNALDLASLDFVKMAPTWREENGTAARAEAALRTSSLSSSPPLVIADTTTTKNVGKILKKTAQQVSFVFISNSLRCFASIHSLEDLAFGHGPLHNQREPVLQRPHVRGRTADSSELAPVRRPRDGQFVRRLRFFLPFYYFYSINRNIKNSIVFLRKRPTFTTEIWLNHL